MQLRPLLRPMNDLLHASILGLTLSPDQSPASRASLNHMYANSQQHLLATGAAHPGQK
jgi:hypothetical protein